MADHEVENLKITLSVDDAGVAEKIDAIKQSFVQLGTAIRGEDAASAIRNLAEGFKIFADTLPKVTSASEAIRKFTDGLATTDFKAFEQGLLNIGNAFSQVRFNEEAAKGIVALSGALTRLSDSAKKFNPTGLERVIAAGEQLDSVAAAVKKASSVGSGFGNLASGLARMPEAIKGMAEVDLSVWNANIEKTVARIKELNRVATTLSGKGTRNFASLATALKTLSEFGKTDSSLAGNLERAGDAVIKFAQNMSSSLDDNVLKRFKEIANSVSRIASSLKQINKANSISGGNSGFLKTPTKTDYRQGWKGTFESLKKTYNQNKRIGNLITREFKKIVSAYKLLGRALAAPIVAPLKGLAKGVQAAGNKVKGYVRKLMGDVARTLAKPISAPFKGIMGAVTSLHKKFLGFLHSVGRIALYRAIRSGIKMITTALKEGVDNLYNWAAVVGNSFKPTMDSLASSALYVKNSLAAMVSPLLDALAPALEAITNKAVEFMNTLNQLFATLTGASTWRKAIRTQAEYSAEVDNTNGALKELKATILGIDEINPLNGDSGGGRGAGNIMPDYKGMFEELPISENFNNIKINFGELGRKISNALADALDSIKWETIKKKVNSVVQKVVDFFNGFFDNRSLWVSVGNTVGEGLNTATGAILTFTDGVNWKSIGANIAEGVKKAIQTINWRDLGRSVVSLVKAYKKIFEGFRESMTPKDWEALKDGISLAVNSALKEFSIDWTSIKNKFKKVANKFTNTFGGYFEGKDMWSTIGGTIGKGINYLHTTVLDLVEKVNWSEVGNAVGRSIGSAVRAIDWKTTIPRLVNFANGLLTALVEAAKEIDFKALISEITAGVKAADWRGFFRNVTDFLIQIWPVIKIPMLFELGKITLGATVLPTLQKAFSAAISLIPWEAKLTIMAVLAGAALVKVGWDELWEYLNNRAEEGQKKTAKWTQNYVDDLYKTGRITKDEYEKMSGQIEGMAQDLEDWVIGAGKYDQAVANSATETGKAVEEIKRYTGSLTDFWKDQRKKLKEDAEQSARESAIEFNRGLANQKPKIEGTAYGINSAMAQALKSGDPWTWGDDFGYLFSRGLIHSAEAYIAPAARNAAASARTYLAFSKPEKGPLSDADKYGPDFMKLFAEGIEQKAYLVANAAKAVASQVEASIPISANVNSTMTASFGADSTALIRSVAQGTEDANASQNELLREQNALLRQILEKTGEGVSAGAIVSSMERASRRAGVAVAIS